jgi:hypothetical protein
MTGRLKRARYRLPDPVGSHEQPLAMVGLGLEEFHVLRIVLATERSAVRKYRQEQIYVSSILQEPSVGFSSRRHFRFSTGA